MSSPGRTVSKSLNFFKRPILNPYETKKHTQIHQNIGVWSPQDWSVKMMNSGQADMFHALGLNHSGFTTSKHFAVSVLRCWPPLPYLGKPCTFSTQPRQCHEPNQPQATNQPQNQAQLITTTCCGPGAWKQVWFPFLRCSKPQKRAVTPSWPEGDLPRSVEGVSFCRISLWGNRVSMVSNDFWSDPKSGELPGNADYADARRGWGI